MSKYATSLVLICISKRVICIFCKL